jgi:hypothetical protein
VRAAVCLAAAAVVVASADAPPPPQDTIVAVGDVHGDVDALVALLRRTGLVDEARRWTGGKATFVQTGDCLDRGPQVREVLDLLMSLEGQASAAGGRVVVLLGNHEAMNVLDILRDVAPAAYASFADARSDARRAEAFDDASRVGDARRAALARTSPDIPVPAVYAATTREAWMAAHPPGMLEYMEAFGPDGRYGKWLRARPVAVRLGDIVFVHGGLHPQEGPKKITGATEQAHKEIARWDRMRAYMIDRGLAAPAHTYAEVVEAGRAELARIAVEARRNGAGERTSLPVEVAGHTLAELLNVDNWSLVNANGPLWFRGFATWSSDEGRLALDALQRRYGPVRFVVGHTPLKPPRQMARFGGRVFLIDSGISSVYRGEGGRPSALEIRGGIYTAVYLDDRTVLFDPMTNLVR